MSDSNTTSAKQNEELQAKVALLEAQLADLERSEAIHRHIVENAPASISRLMPDGRLIFANQFALELLGYSLEELQGQNIIPLMYPGELQADVDEYFRLASEGQDVSDYELTCQTRSGERRILAWNSYHRYDSDGQLLEVISFGMDVTERKQAEREHRAVQERIISMQAATLAELSTPLIPISDDIVVMPLVGMIDSTRAQQIIESLLTGVTERRARTAIVDITGISIVDTQVANAILTAARAVRLLGARVVLTGIRPNIAQTLVALGTDFQDIVTRSTLQSGIEFALSQKK